MIFKTCRKPRRWSLKPWLILVVDTSAVVEPTTTLLIDVMCFSTPVLRIGFPFLSHHLLISHVLNQLLAPNHGTRIKQTLIALLTFGLNLWPFRSFFFIAVFLTDRGISPSSVTSNSRFPTLFILVFSRVWCLHLRPPIWPPFPISAS